MKIIYEGNDSRAFSYCTEAHLAESFRALGHEVIYVIVQESSTSLLDHLVATHEPDIFLLTRPWGTASGATPRFLARCEARGVQTVGFHLDKFWGLPEREEWIIAKSDPLFHCGHLFTTDGAWEAQWAEAGITHHWLPPGVFHRECYDADPDPQRWPFDVAFVGSAPTTRGGNYHPEHSHRGELVAWLRDTYGDRFVHAGNGGEPTVRGHDLNVLYASVPVIVGDSCQVAADKPYWSDRVPETWGRGGFLVHPRVDALEEQIGPYPGHRWEPGDWDGLRDTIDGWLGDAYARDHTRERIAATIRSGHTYRDRACEMLTVLGYECGADSEEAAA